MKLIMLTSLIEVASNFLILLAIVVIIGYIVAFIMAIKYFKSATIRPKKINERVNIPRWHQYLDKLALNLKSFNSLDKEDVSIKGYKNKIVKGYFIKSNQNTNKVVIFSHGWQKDGPNDYASNGYFLHDLGYNVLLIDHLAHGRSEGKYINFGVYDSVNIQNWVKYINERFNHKCEIFLFGVSMGATATLLTVDKDMENVKKIIADSGFCNGCELAKYIMSTKTKFFLPVVIFNIRLITLLVAKYDINKANTIDKVSHSKYPILFLHGEKDDFVPVENSVRNYEACTSEKTIVIFDNAKHIVSGVMDPIKYQTIISNFLEKNS